LLWPLGKPFRLLPGGVRSGGVWELAVALVVLGFAGFFVSLVYPAIDGLF
jgi:inner membrane protein